MSTVLNITGPLNFDTVPHVWAETMGQFGRVPVIQMDCSGVTDCSSAALALFIEWIIEARRKKTGLRLTGIPDSLMRMAATCGVRKLFEDHQ